VYLGGRNYGDEYFENLHVPLVDSERFEKVQKLMEATLTYTVTGKKTKSPLILLGITKCGICGSSLTMSTGKNGKYFIINVPNRLTKQKISARQSRSQSKHLRILL